MRTYKLKQTFSAPNIYAVKGKGFAKKGQEVQGNLYDSRNKPSFEDCILVHDSYLIPLNVLELTKEIKTVNFSAGEIPEGTTRVEVKTNNVKKEAKHYTIGVAIGGAVGFLLFSYGVHKGWFQRTWKNRLLIIGGGGVMGGYLANVKK